MEMRVPSEQQRVLELSRWGRKSELGAPRKKAVRKGFGHKEWDRKQPGLYVAARPSSVPGFARTPLRRPSPNVNAAQFAWVG